MADGTMTIDPNGLLPFAATAHGVGEQLPTAGNAVSAGWSPPSGFVCASAVTTCQGAWYGTYVEASTTFTTIGDKLLSTVGVVGSADDDSADQFDRTRGDTGLGRYEEYE